MQAFLCQRVCCPGRGGVVALGTVDHLSDELAYPENAAFGLLFIVAEDFLPTGDQARLS